MELMRKEFPRAQRQREAHSHSSTYLHHGNKLSGNDSISVGSKPIHRIFLFQLPLFFITLFPNWERSCVESQVPTDLFFSSSP